MKTHAGSDSHFGRMGTRLRQDLNRHFGCYLGYIAVAIALPGLIVQDNWHAIGWCLLALLWNIVAHRTSRDFYTVTDIAEQALNNQEEVLYSYNRALRYARKHNLPTSFPL